MKSNPIIRALIHKQRERYSNLGFFLQCMRTSDAIAVSRMRSEEVAKGTMKFIQECIDGKC